MTQKGKSNDILKRFEMMLKSKKLDYFEVEEFGNIIHTYLRQMNFQKADKAIKIGLLQHPESPVIMLSKAHYLHLNGNTQQALQIINQIQQAEPDFFGLFILKGIIHLDLGKVTEAKNAFETAKKLCPDDEINNLTYDIGQIFMDYNLFEDALITFKSIEKEQEAGPSFLLDLAVCYENILDLRNAEYYYNKYIDANPYDFTAWFMFANCYTSFGEHNKAVDALDFCIAINDTFEMAFFQKGYNLFKLERFDESLNNFRKFVSFKSNAFIAYYFMGVCYQKSGDLKNARKYFRLTIDNDIRQGINTADPYINLGETYETDNKSALAARYYYYAYKVDPFNPYAIKKLAFFHVKNAIFISENYFRQLEKMDFISPETYIDYCTELLNHAHFNHLVRISRSALKIFPENTELKRLYILALYKTYQTKKIKRFVAFMKQPENKSWLIHKMGEDSYHHILNTFDKSMKTIQRRKKDI